MVVLLCYTLAFSEVIYVDFYAKILHWNFRLVDENSRILVVVFVSKLNFSFSFRFVDENYRIFVVVVVFVTKINLLSSTKIFVFVVVDEKNTVMYFRFCGWHHRFTYCSGCQGANKKWKLQRPCQGIHMMSYWPGSLPSFARWQHYVVAMGQNLLF